MRRLALLTMTSFATIVVAGCSVFGDSDKDAGCVSDSALAARYHFAGDAIDNSENANHGVVFGAIPAPGSSGDELTALTFTSDSQYVSLPRAVSLRGQAEVSVGARVKLNSIPNNNVLFFESTSSSTAARFILSVLENGAVSLAWRDANFEDRVGRLAIQSAPVVAFQEWADIVAVVSAVNQTQRLYLDGNLVYSDSIRTQNIGDSRPAMLRIGRLTTRSLNYLDGTLDELVIYKRALANEEVPEIFNSCN